MSLDERLQYVAMKSRHKNLLLPWYKKWWGILILITLAIFLIILIASTFYVIDKVKQIQAEKQQTNLETGRQEYLQAINGDGSNYKIGAANPQLTITEFGDFACPFCAQSATAIRKVVTQYPNQVKFIFRDYPLHDNSIDLALAARCAGEQNKFWEMHDQLFANQEVLNASTTELSTGLATIASQLKLNVTQFNLCISDRKYVSQIKRDYEDGEILAIKGTPTWFVNNYTITGYLTEENFTELINGLIK